LPTQPTALPTPRRSFQDFRAFTRVVVRRTLRGFFDAHGYDLGASLAYTSLLTFVPLVAAVTLLTSTLFGESESGLFTIFRTVLPATSPKLLEDLGKFAAQAKKLSGWATLFFVLASLRMYLLVEGAANALWGAELRRRPLIRLGVGLAVVVLGPIAFGVLTSLLLQSGARVAEFRFSGLLGSIALLTLLYWAVPSARVRGGPALAAGIFAGVGLSLLKLGFAKAVALINELNHIYGSISAIVIFVLAIGIVWDLLLLGVSFAHAVQFRHELLAHDEPEREARRSGPLEDAVRMLLSLAVAYRKDEPIVSVVELSDIIRHPEDDTRSRLKKLASAGLILPAGEDGYRLARAPEEISLYTVARAAGEAAPRALPAGDDPADALLRRLYRRADREVRGVLQGTSLRDIVDSAGDRSRREIPKSGTFKKVTGR
jgi:membrane protein